MAVRAAVFGTGFVDQPYLNPTVWVVLSHLPPMDMARIRGGDKNFGQRLAAIPVVSDHGTP